MEKMNLKQARLLKVMEYQRSKDVNILRAAYETAITEGDVEIIHETAQAYFTVVVQNHLDNQAQERGYDNIVSACSYASSSDKIFATEGNAYVVLRDGAWRKCYTILDEVKAGKRPIPSVEDLLAELPVIVL